MNHPQFPRVYLLIGIVALALGSRLGAQETLPFVHPGCLSTQADLDRMKAKIAANAQPWKAGYDMLAANSHSSASYTAYPHPVVCRGGACAGMGLSQDYMTMANDAAAAYQCALRYRLTGDTAFADAAMRNMDGYTATLQRITGDSNALLAQGAQGYQFACAAELLRNYQPWVDSGGFAAFQTLLLEKFYGPCSSFLQRHNGTCDSHYWANWDLFAMNAVIAIGVACDRRDIYEEAINYYLEGIGNGAADHVVWFRHPGKLGQGQESGRDQGHNTLLPVLLGTFCEIAWNQGDDMYGHLDNNLLALSEYVAKYNLGNEVPYVTYHNCDDVVQTRISDNARGTYRPGYELIYNHYVNRRGLSAPYTMRMALSGRPEGGGGNYGNTSGGYDQIGFTTLTHTLDPLPRAAVPAPGSLTADVRNNTVVLSWWGSARATRYRVKRATEAGGPYTVIADTVPGDRFTYTDTCLAQGTTYEYVVSALVDGTETADSAPLAVTPNLLLTGTVIGSDGSYYWGVGKENAFDGAIVTHYDADSASGDWAGLDLGVPHLLTRVAYAPRAAFPGRMVGGQFQGSNTADFSSGVVTLHTIGSAPEAGVMTGQDISNPTAFRYVRYLGPANGSCNVAELQFFGYPSPAAVPVAPSNLTAVAGDGKVTLAWSAPAGATAFNVKRAGPAGGAYVTIATAITSAHFLDTAVTNGAAYTYVVSALDATGEGAASVAVTATPSSASLEGRTTWAGALSGVWDTDTLNWQVPGALSLYQAGDAVLFDDSSSPYTTVTIAAPVAPASVAFDNGWRAYTLGGAAINSPGAFTKSGAGTVLLTGANSFGGGATLGGGEVSVQNPGALGSGTIALAGGTLSGRNGVTLSNNVVVSGSGAIQLANATNFTLAGAVSGNGSLTLGDDDNAYSLTVAGANTMSGGSVTVANNGNFVRFTNAAAGNASLDWTFANSTAGRTTLEFASGTFHLGSLAGSGVVQGNRSGANSMNVTLQVGANNHSTLFSGILRDNRLGTGPLGLTKVGVGTLQLTGACDYSGPTTVSAGTLVLATAFAGKGACLVSGGATLGLLKATSTAGTLGNLTMAAGSTLAVLRPASATTPLFECGTLTVSGACPVAVTLPEEGLSPGTYPLLKCSSLAPGAFENLQLQLPAGVNGTLVQDAGLVSLSIDSVPVPAAPAQLSATLADGQIVLAWTASAYAETYEVWRASVSGGGYTRLAVTYGTTLTDTWATAAGTYYYIVTATNSFGSSPASTEAGATTLGAGRNAIGIDFRGGSGTSAMAATESAGAVPLPNWNNAASASGTLAALKDYAGGASSASVTWASNNTWSTSIADTAGDNRMMKGYLDTSSSSTTTVTVSGLPASVTANGYRVYVYRDGDNGGSTHSGNYTIGATTIAATDSPNTNFAGTYTQANNSAGNYVVFAGLGGASFTLTAQAGQARAPINGIQIVAGENTASMPAAPAGLSFSAVSSGRIDLSWAASSGATGYNIRRSGSPGGPYVVLATNVAAASYSDTSISRPGAYYYVVSAVNGAGEGPLSAELLAVPGAPRLAISIDFQGGGTNGTPALMAASETAGAVPLANWTSLAGGSGTAASLHDSAGASTTAGVTWSSSNGWSTHIADSAGDNRMMKGYLDTSNTSTTTVNVTSIPAAFTGGGYDVYVYCDGDAGSTKAGQYTLGGTTTEALDTGGVHFSGTYVPAAASAGNYVRFSNLSATSFTLGARGNQSYSGPRAPVNGLQIVARPPAAPASLVAIPSASGGGIDLAWSPVSGATLYYVKRSSAAGVSPVVIAVSSSANFADLGLSNGVTYRYVVTAISATGESTASNEAVATPLTPLAQWRVAHFGTTEAVGDAADLADPDGDGRPNLLEYALGGDPLVADIAAQSAATLDASGRLALTFSRTADGSLLYTVETSTDLVAWTTFWSSTGADNTAGLVTVTYPDPIVVGTPRFLRLRVEIAE